MKRSPSIRISDQIKVSSWKYISCLFYLKDPQYLVEKKVYKIRIEGGRQTCLRMEEEGTRLVEGPQIFDAIARTIFSMINGDQFPLDIKPSYSPHTSYLYPCGGKFYSTTLSLSL